MDSVPSAAKSHVPQHRSPPPGDAARRLAAVPRDFPAVADGRPGALFVGLVAALIFSGAAAAREVSDPGALVRWGLPVSKAIHNVALATVIGGLIFAVGILPRRRARLPVQGPDAPEHPAFTRALAMAAAAGAVWTLSAIAVLVLTLLGHGGAGHLRGRRIHPRPGVLHDGHRDRTGLAGRHHHRRRSDHGPVRGAVPAAAWR